MRVQRSASSKSMMGSDHTVRFPGVDMRPPAVCLPLLAKFDQPGYTVSALPDKKKQRAFRISDADGNVTTFTSIRLPAA